jgi:hypothetical protein
MMVHTSARAAEATADDSVKMTTTFRYLRRFYRGQKSINRRARAPQLTLNLAKT